MLNANPSFEVWAGFRNLPIHLHVILTASVYPDVQYFAKDSFAVAIRA